MDFQSTIRLEFTLKLDDYLQFQRSIVRHQLRWLRPIAALLTICFLLAPLFPWDGTPNFLEKYCNWTALLVLPCLIFVVIPAMLYVFGRKRWRDAAELHEPRTYEFSDSGVTCSGRTFSGSTQWVNIRRAEVSGPLILLWTSQRTAHIIPVVALGNQENAEEFKSLIRQKVQDSRHLQ